MMINDSLDEAGIRKQAVDAILQGVARKTALLTAAAAAAAVSYAVVLGTGRQWGLVPMSVLFGAVLGLLNFRWLAAAVQRVYLRKGATPVGANLAAVIISGLKLSAIFVILFFIIKYQMAHIFGLVGGLSLCFVAILWEGATSMKQFFKSDDGGA